MCGSVCVSDHACVRACMFEFPLLGNESRVIGAPRPPEGKEGRRGQERRRWRGKMKFSSQRLSPQRRFHVKQ